MSGRSRTYIKSLQPEDKSGSQETRFYHLNYGHKEGREADSNTERPCGRAA